MKGSFGLKDMLCGRLCLKDTSNYLYKQIEALPVQCVNARDSVTSSHD